MALMTPMSRLVILNCKAHMASKKFNVLRDFRRDNIANATDKPAKSIYSFQSFAEHADNSPQEEGTLSRLKYFHCFS